MSEMLREKQLVWCRSSFVIGQSYLFRDMEATTERIKRETELSKTKAEKRN